MRKNVMKTAILLGLALSCLSSASYASLSDWGRMFTVSSGLQDSRSTTLLLGINPTASNGYDSSDLFSTIAGQCDAYVRTYHVNGEDEWSGSTGFYRVDYCAPMASIPGYSKTWTMYVWADPTLSETASFIGLDFGYNGGIPDGLSFTLTLTSKPSEVTDGPAVGTVWNLSEPPYGVKLPVFRTDNGLEGYVFDFTATVVPEPASLLALCAGLIPLALKRRRG